ncbi:RES family NAD+ phosphorylase [Streptomyces sp. NBC_00094]|uniref:RES family NAD+ phosphorylase n=1 Tax=Streptomyces sp. NBC_00094 TaxID=2903620 RepID=UPI00224D3455|nr:RES family NAD+ phosphorylase [Streptomyces sp. NBC_00094]MCX5393762.1 RES family NAD+ phosphorylase [Streptomyces sp. NBC_00094]
MNDRTHGITFFPMIEEELHPNLKTIPAGTELWRVHKSTYRAGQFNPKLADIHFFGGRFEGTPLDPYHSLYVADSGLTAVAESMLRSVAWNGTMREIPYAVAHGRSLSVLRTTCDLTVVSLIEEKDLAAVRRTADLLDDERSYATARRWASEIRAQAPDALGLVWQSRRNRPQEAMVLFHDRFDALPGPALEVLPGRGIADLGSPEGLEEVNRLLDPLSARVSQPLR